MKTNWKIWVAIITCVCVFGILTTLVLVFPSKKQTPKQQNFFYKSNSELLGSRCSIDRNGKEPVPANIYVPKSDTALPLLINIHGGGFVSGSSDMLDTQSNRLSLQFDCVVLTIDYKRVDKTYSKEYAIEEIVDTIKFFKQNPTTNQWNIDPEQIFVMGYSAGGYYALASVIELKSQNIDVAGQILCYPCMEDATKKYDKLENKVVAPALFVICKHDDIANGWTDFEQLLKDNTQTSSIVYENGEHGFLEVNNPEYDRFQDVYAKNDEQKQLMLDAETKIGNWITSVLQK